MPSSACKKIITLPLDDPHQPAEEAVEAEHSEVDLVAVGSHPHVRHFELVVFFFKGTATTEIYTLSLHDALPICPASAPRRTGKLREVIRALGYKKHWSDPLSSTSPQVAETRETDS